GEIAGNAQQVVDTAADSAGLGKFELERRAGIEAHRSRIQRARTCPWSQRAVENDDVADRGRPAKCPTSSDLNRTAAEATGHNERASTDSGCADVSIGGSES